MKHVELEELMAKHGKVKSLKISLNGDHSSRGYGFVCFDSPDIADSATNQHVHLGEDQVLCEKFEPKDKREIRRVVNNIYVKNFPDSWSEDDIKQKFSEHGHIKSIVIFKNEKGRFGFICYEDPTGKDKEYGPKAAEAAVEALHEKDVGEELKLYVA